jgi:hypothetical protein
MQVEEPRGPDKLSKNDSDPFVRRDDNIEEIKAEYTLDFQWHATCSVYLSSSVNHKELQT